MQQQPIMPWRRGAIILSVVLAILVAAGGVAYHGQHHFDRFDWNILKWVYDNFSRRSLHDLLKVTTPAATTGIVLLVTIIALVRRNVRLAAAVAGGGALAFVLTEFLLKPLIDRKVPAIPGLPLVNGAYAYPSGHETGVASATTVLVLLVFALTTSTALRISAIAAALAVDLIGSLALVGNYYHYATDTFAAIGVSVASILAVALVIDRMPDRRVSSPAAGIPASTAHGA